MRVLLKLLFLFSVVASFAVACGRGGPAGTYESLPDKKVAAAGEMLPAKLELKDGRVTIFVSDKVLVRGSYTIEGDVITVQPEGKGPDRRFPITIQKDGSLLTLQRTFVRR